MLMGRQIAILIEAPQGFECAYERITCDVIVRPSSLYQAVPWRNKKKGGTFVVAGAQFDQETFWTHCNPLSSELIRRLTRNVKPTKRNAPWTATSLFHSKPDTQWRGNEMGVVCWEVFTTVTTAILIVLYINSVVFVVEIFTPTKVTN